MGGSSRKQDKIFNPSSGNWYNMDTRNGSIQTDHPSDSPFYKVLAGQNGSDFSFQGYNAADNTWKSFNTRQEARKYGEANQTKLAPTDQVAPVDLNAQAINARKNLEKLGLKATKLGQ